MLIETLKPRAWLGFGLAHTIDVIPPQPHLLQPKKTNNIIGLGMAAGVAYSCGHAAELHLQNIVVCQQREELGLVATTVQVEVDLGGQVPELRVPVACKLELVCHREFPAQFFATLVCQFRLGM